METLQIFDRIWRDYSSMNPSVRKIHDLFSSEGETVVNDHIAFRTLDIDRINIDVIARPLIARGYVVGGEYFFNDKHLYARHYEIPGDPSAPKVFISQLILGDCPVFVKSTFHDLLKNISPDQLSSEDLLFSGTMFNPVSYETYTHLKDESEYAGWFYVFGFRANHFTVSVNSLKKFTTLESVNTLLKQNGFILNLSGGEIKGTPGELLQQSSTMADIIKVQFTDGIYEIPSCYYEFALRYKGSDGRLFGGFIAGSADKIFESTHFHTGRQPGN